MALQFIKSRRRGKPTTWYVYAYKGGPQIMKHVGPRRPALDAAASRKLTEALAAREAPTPSDKFRSVVRSWRASPEWEQLAASTKGVWRRHVDLIEERWGDAPTSVWNDPRMKAKVVAWRNSRKDKPRTADIGVTVLSALLKWAMLSGHGIVANAAAEVPNLYRGGNRQEIIWLPEDIERFAAVAEKEGKPWVLDGLRLAALTGLRLADLVSLTFDHVGEGAITKTALKKSRGKRFRVTIPKTEELGALLAELRDRPRQEGVNTVLVNGYGRPWTPGGFGGSFNSIRNVAGIVHVDDEGTERRKHLHDVRGTFCTILLTEWELTDEEAAEIMGWSKERVSGIRKVYVDGNRLAMAIADRIAAKQKAKQAAKSGASA
jgi:integrase